MPKKKKRKYKKRSITWTDHVNLNQNQAIKKNFFSELPEFVYVILAFIIGWGYVFLWMNTSYYDHNYELFDQPYFLHAFIPPSLVVFIIFLNYRPGPHEEYIGNNLAIHVVSILVLSFFAVGCFFGMMIIGMLLIGMVGVIIQGIFF